MLTLGRNETALSKCTGLETRRVAYLGHQAGNVMKSRFILQMVRGFVAGACMTVPCCAPTDGAALYVASISVSPDRVAHISAGGSASKVSIYSLSPWVEAWRGFAAQDDKGRILSVGVSGQTVVRSPAQEFMESGTWAISSDGRWIAFIDQDARTVICHAIGADIDRRFQIDAKQLEEAGVLWGRSEPSLVGFVWADDGQTFGFTVPIDGSEDSGGIADVSTVVASANGDIVGTLRGVAPVLITSNGVVIGVTDRWEGEYRLVKALTREGKELWRFGPACAVASGLRELGVLQVRGDRCSWQLVDRLTGKRIRSLLDSSESPAVYMGYEAVFGVVR